MSKIIIFSHPDFLGSQSMPRYAQWLAMGIRQRGYETEMWKPIPKIYNFPFPKRFKKWLGYMDEYILFPQQVRRKLKKQPKDTLFVIADQALGPWVPLVKERLHVVHCMDFLAQRSALGEIPENPTGKTGQLYQKYIRNGYRQGKNFISISKNTRKDLHRFLGFQPKISEAIYLGLTRDFHPAENKIALCEKLSNSLNIPVNSGFFLHISGGQWYKNKAGVVYIYNAWRKISPLALPLVLVGSMGEDVNKIIADSPFCKEIFVLKNADDQLVQDLYAGASMFLFPSLAEGFGWPIAEAMASGTPVVTTNEPPMNEVAGDAAILADRMPRQQSEIAHWAMSVAEKIERFMQMSEAEKIAFINKGIENAKRFDSEKALDEIEKVYRKILSSQ